MDSGSLRTKIHSSQCLGIQCDIALINWLVFIWSNHAAFWIFEVMILPRVFPSLFADLVTAFTNETRRVRISRPTVAKGKISYFKVEMMRRRDCLADDDVTQGLCYIILGWLRLHRHHPRCKHEQQLQVAGSACLWKHHFNKLHSIKPFFLQNTSAPVLWLWIFIISWKLSW